MEEVEVFNCELKDIRVGLLWEMDLNHKAAVLHAVTGQQRIGMHFFCVAFPLGFFCEELSAWIARYATVITALPSQRGWRLGGRGEVRSCSRLLHRWTKRAPAPASVAFDWQGAMDLFAKLRSFGKVLGPHRRLVWPRVYGSVAPAGRPREFLSVG